MDNIRTQLGRLIRETHNQAEAETDLHERERLEGRVALWQELYDNSADNARGGPGRR